MVRLLIFAIVFSLFTTASALVLCRRLSDEFVDACKQQYTPVVAYVTIELRAELVKNPDLAALLSRVAWHSSGTYNPLLTPVGGSYGGCIRVAPEYTDPANAVIDDALVFVARMRQQHGFVSFADMVQLTASVAHELTGAYTPPVQMYFTPGRLDYHDFTAAKKCAPNRLPPKEIVGDKFPLPQTQKFVLENFGRYLPTMPTFADAQGRYDPVFVESAVALMGGHALGGMHLGTSGNEGTFTTNPHVFDNQYYVNLIELEWEGAQVGGSRANGSTRTDLQYWRRGVTLLPTDVAVAQHPQMKLAARKFAGNNTAFLEAYAWVFEELGENGVDRGEAPPTLATRAPVAGGGETTCTASDLVHTTTTTYACMRALPVPGLTLHWTNTDSLLSVALLNDAPTGWFAMSFPTVAGLMIPAPHALVFADGTLQLMSISSRSLAGFTAQPTPAGITGAAHEVLNGKQVIRFDFANGSAFNPAQAFINVARDASDTLGTHAAGNRASISLNFASGVGVETADSSTRYWRKVHGYLMGLATLFVIPLGIFSKRYGKKLFGVSGSTVWPFGVAFIAHMGCMITGSLMIFTAMLIAVTKLRSVRVEEDVYSHRALGMVCVVLVMLVPTMGSATRFLPAVSYKPHRKVHAVLGVAMLIMMFAQVVTGWKKIKFYHPDLEIPVLSLLATGFSFIAFVGLSLELTSRCAAVKVRRVTDENRKGDEQGKALISREEVRQHATDDPWIILEGKIYEVGIWTENHPGGSDVIMETAGLDATERFYSVQHSATAMRILRDFYVGDLEGAEISSCIDVVGKVAQAMLELDIESAELLLRTPPEDLPRSLVIELKELLGNLAAYKPYLPEHLIGAFAVENSTVIFASNPLALQTPAMRLFEASPPEKATMVFTDIQASTVLWESCNSGMKKALDMHNGVIRSIIGSNQGYEVKTIGDAFMVAFIDSENAVRFGLKVQETLVQQEWPLTLLDQPLCTEVRSKTDGAPIWAGLRVRIGIHVGEVDAQKNPLTGRLDFFGNTVNKAARVEAKSVGGALCVTEEVLSEITNQEMMKTMCLIPMGSVTLKGVKEKAKLTLVLPECLEARKTEVISSFMRVTAPAVQPGSGLGSSISSLRSKSGLQSNHLSIANGTAATSMISYRSTQDDMPLPFSEVASLVSKMMEDMTRTEGAFVSLSGSCGLGVWGVLKRCTQHVVQAARYTTRFSVKTFGEDSDVSCQDFITTGISTGTCVHGHAGRQVQKVPMVVGLPIDVSLHLAQRAADLRCSALSCTVQGNTGLAEDTVIGKCCRPVDVWATGVFEPRWLVIQEVNVMKLSLLSSSHGFADSKPCDLRLWGKGKLVRDVLHDLSTSKGVISAQELVRIYETARQEMTCACDAEVTHTCSSCQMTSCPSCRTHLRAESCPNHWMEQDPGIGSRDALRHMSDIFGPAWLGGEEPTAPKIFGTLVENPTPRSPNAMPGGPHGMAPGISSLSSFTKGMDAVSGLHSATPTLPTALYIGEPASPLSLMHHRSPRSF
eukprot:Rhum_TRINITY_DN14773_c9_g1::Rhum_TRINITY_DN14773_c9_g1_i5::g.117293::m.117293